jgi:hypothetical protein
MYVDNRLRDRAVSKFEILIFKRCLRGKNRILHIIVKEFPFSVMEGLNYHAE